MIIVMNPTEARSRYEVGRSVLRKLGSYYPSVADNEPMLMRYLTINLGRDLVAVVLEDLQRANHSRSMKTLDSFLNGKTLYDVLGDAEEEYLEIARLIGKGDITWLARELEIAMGKMYEMRPVLAVEVSITLFFSHADIEERSRILSGYVSPIQLTSGRTLAGSADDRC